MNSLHIFFIFALFFLNFFFVFETHHCENLNEPTKFAFFHLLFKCLASSCFLGLGIFNFYTNEKSRYSKFICLEFVVSWIGDFFLGFPSSAHYFIMLGIVFFQIAQIFLVYAQAVEITSKKKLFQTIFLYAVVLACFQKLIFYNKFFPFMISSNYSIMFVVCGFLYVSFIGLMFTLSVVSLKFWRILAASLFVISDILTSTKIFVPRGIWLDFDVFIKYRLYFYYAAQFFFAVSIIKN